jgi:hypothetical protein
LSLGVQTPIWDIALATKSQEIDVVALSFSSVANPTMVIQGLTELRSKLPLHVDIWAGGRSQALRQRRIPDGVKVVTDLSELGEAVSAWRNRARD